MGTTNGRNGSERPLRSWKEIAAFFGRDERTVKRWESSRGLPVYRVPGQTRASVYAYSSELQAWLTGHRETGLIDDSPADPAALPALVMQNPTAPAFRLPNRRLLLAGAGAFALLAAGYFSFPVFSRLAGASRPADGLLSADPEARELYLSGNYQLSLRTDQSLHRAIQFFTQAITADPDFAAAYAGLSKGYNLLAQYTDTPPEVAYPLAKAAGERALKLDPSLASGYATLGFTTFYWDRDFPRSRELFERSLALDADSAETNHWMALTVMQTGAFDEALAAINRAQQLDPNSRAILANKGLILYHAGRLEEAGALLRQFADTAPGYPAPYFYLADIYFDQGRYREWFEQSLAAAGIVKNEALRAAIEAAKLGYASSGKQGMLEALLDEQRRQLANGKGSAYKVARTSAFLGLTDQALTYLTLSAAEHEPDIIAIKIDTAFAALREDERFRDLVVKAGHTIPAIGTPMNVAVDPIKTGTEVPH